MAKGLGRGLNALFAESSGAPESDVQEVALKEIRPNPHQPRKVFKEEAIEELKQSILVHGILQPIVLRKSSDKKYEIVAGERRFRAAKAAGLQKVPVLIKELSDAQMMELALLENLQREDLTVMEEATAYQHIMDKLDLSTAELAERIGKSRPHIANYIRLLELPAEIQAMLAEEQLSMGHARAILGIKAKKKQLEAAAKTVKEKWSVRQLEQWIREVKSPVSRETPPRQPNMFLRDCEETLRERFGAPVQIKQSKRGDTGKIEIAFESQDELNRLLELLDSGN